MVDIKNREESRPALKGDLPERGIRPDIHQKTFLGGTQFLKKRFTVVPEKDIQKILYFTVRTERTLRCPGKKDKKRDIGRERAHGRQSSREGFCLHPAIAEINAKRMKKRYTLISWAEWIRSVWGGQDAIGANLVEVDANAKLPQRRAGGGKPH